ncbi:MAG: flagellar hook-length control protein FliK [Spirochaetales bacterium]|nr:flagellar hook-length control protein FliK [Spirochaetales bacterium]
MAQSVPIIAQETNNNQTAQVKKKEGSGNDNKPGKDEKTSFAAIIEKVEKENQSIHTNIKKTTNGESRLLKFISQIIKSIQDKLPGSLKNNLLTLVKNIIEQKGFSEKEKGDILKTLLQKIQKKSVFPASLADDISALAFSPGKDIRDTSLKNKLIAGIHTLMDEKTDKEKRIAHDVSSKLVIIDLRKGKSQKEQGHIQEKSAGVSGKGEAGSTTGHTLKLDTHEGSSDTILYFSLKDGTGSQEMNQKPVTIGREHDGFDRQMMEKLRNSLQNEMVKHTKIILKENGNGEIRIVLKPESLGSIRMRVNVQNNHIDGRIFVENNNIKEIVDQAMNNLNHAFKHEGFDSISLRVSVGNGNNQDQQDGKQESRQEGPAVYSYTEAAEEFGKNLEVLFDGSMDYSRVNLFI